MIVEVVKQDHLTAIRLWTHDCVFLFVGGSRVSHVLAFGGGTKQRWQRLWVILDYKRTVFCVNLLEVQLKNIVIGR